MNSSIKELRAASIVAWASLFVTLLVTDKLSTDPVNLSKQLALSAFAFCLVPFLLNKRESSFREFKYLNIPLIVFLTATFSSVFLSENSIERGLYGSFGRNTGFLTYFCLAIFLLITSRFGSEESFKKIIKFFVIAGSLNIVYSIAASNGYDLFTWANPYNSVLGTFGNPNFIGAFMGMFATVLFVQLFANLNSPRFLLVNLIALGLTIYVILLTNALQGILVAAFGFTFALYFYLRSIERFSKLSTVYLVSVLFGGFIVFLGIFQKGPLSSYLYKPSVTFRGEYWRTGINMWADNPFFGVGIDSYGQYYRTYRSLSSTVAPGMETTTDAAHNVYIDVLAGTGIFGFLGYFFLSVFVLFCALKFIRSIRSFDPIFYSLFLGWCSYQLQSLVSINQIGLALWGWVLGGAVIGYSRMSISNQQKSADSSGVTKPRVKGKVKIDSELLDASVLLKSTICLVVGFLLALPPFMKDVSMRTFLTGKGTPEELIQLVKEWPRDSNRMSRTYVILAQNDRGLEARELAAYTTTIFPNDYASWYALYQIAQLDTPERAAYKVKLHEIDPHNPAYFK
jgi:O-antigen ligase